jgi:DNA-binding transcriptional LysR family regulator
MDPASFAAKFDLVLKALSLSRGRLAADLGVDKSAVSRWGSGTVAPSAHNLMLLTGLVAARKEGFTLLDWERDIDSLAALMGVEPPSTAAPAPMAGGSSVMPLFPQMPFGIEEASRREIERKGGSYEGIWRITRPSSTQPGMYVKEHMMIRREGEGLALRIVGGAHETRGHILILQGQLYGVAADAHDDSLLFAVFNGASAPKVERIEGVMGSVSADAFTYATSMAAICERMSDLTDDPQADTARFEALKALPIMFMPDDGPAAMRLKLKAPLRCVEPDREALAEAAVMPPPMPAPVEAVEGDPGKFRFDWNDLCHFLAVARSGSTLGAAKQLGVSQPTVVRRIATLEDALGAALFERRPSGYELSEVGRELLPHAEKVEAAVMGFGYASAAAARVQTQVIRVTAPENMANLVIPAIMQEFHRTHPSVQVQLITDDRRLDLNKGEADVALRAGSTPDDPTLVARRLPDLAWGVYCSPVYAAQHGVPASAEEVAGHLLVGGEGIISNLPGLRWLDQIAPSGQVVWRCNTLTNLCTAIAGGLGVSVLPALAGTQAGLVRCFPVAELTAELWLVTRAELRGMPHVRAFMDCLANHMRRLRPLLSGEGDADLAALPAV